MARAADEREKRATTFVGVNNRVTSFHFMIRGSSGVGIIYFIRGEEDLVVGAGMAADERVARLPRPYEAAPPQDPTVGLCLYPGPYTPRRPAPAKTRQRHGGLVGGKDM